MLKVRKARDGSGRTVLAELNPDGTERRIVADIPAEWNRVRQVDPWATTSTSAAAFHRLAISGSPTGIAASAKRNDIVHVGAFDRTAHLTEIKQANPGCKVIAYTDPSRLTNWGNTPVTLDEANAKGWNSGIYDEAFDTYLPKISDPAYQARCRDSILAQLRANRFDGVYLDDMNAGLREEEMGWPAADWRKGQEALNAVIGPAVRAAGYLIFGQAGSLGESDIFSGGWVERQLRYFDGLIDEFFTTWPNGDPAAYDFYLRAFEIMGRAAAAGKYYLASTFGDPSFALALAMLQQSGRRVLLHNPQDYNVEFWPAVFDTAKALGSAKGPKVSTGSGQWRRDFQFGFVTADLPKRTGSIQRS